MRSSLVRTAAFVAFLAIGGALGCSVSGSTDFDEVRKLFLLEGEAYENARDELLRSRPGRWDQQAADAEEGDLGLAVFILNARIADPEIFEALDSLTLGYTVSGIPMLNYSDSPGGAAWHAFVIEHAWKYLWPEQACWELIDRWLMRQDIGGSAAMWEKYSAPSVNPLLRSVAIYALGKHPGFKERAAAILAEEGDRDYFGDLSFARESVLRSLENYAPEYTASLIIETKPHWQDDRNLQDSFVRLLVREAAGDPRPLLYRWLHDDSVPVGLKKGVVTVLTFDPQPRDAIEVKKLLEEENLSDEWRESFTWSLEELQKKVPNSE